MWMKQHYLHATNGKSSILYNRCSPQFTLVTFALLTTPLKPQVRLRCFTKNRGQILEHVSQHYIRKHEEPQKVRVSYNLT